MSGWQHVHQDETSNVKRLMVVGGWLYKYEGELGGQPVVQIVFVGAPE